ncbi:MAG TPA: FAD-binding protein, partial [Flavobacterium sp.]|nr:FAD-binding protein [Flavobacterium sp.]
MKNWILLFLLPLMTTAQPVFTEQQVEISQWIKGDLYIPEESNGHLVIVIAGSGPTNRDGNQPGARSNAYKFLAEAIVANGNPVFTFDKRIVTQIIAGKANEKELLFDHQIDDVRDIIRHFRKDSNIRKIIICGHSEGSLIGVVAAQMADGYISLAGAGRTIDLVITDGACTGVICWKLDDGTIHVFNAKMVVLATGGYGRAYFSATSAHTCTGDGGGMA